MDFESMVRELIEQGIPASLVGGVIIITNPDTGEQRGLSTNIPEDVDIFRNIHAQYVPEDDGSDIVGGITGFVRDAASGVGGLWGTEADILQGGGDNEPTNATGQVSPQNQGEGQQLSEQDKNLAESMGWDFDKHGALPPLRDWKNDPIPGTIDWPLVEDILSRIIKADDRSIVEEERKRAAKARYDTREDAQAAADLRNRKDPGWLVTHEPTTDSYYIYKDFKPRFSVDAQGNQIMQTSEGGVWEIVEEEEKYIPKTREEYLLQLVAQGKYDEAAQFDQIMDQFEAERMTPERAAEMLVNIAYNPYDFKAMMDAMLGRDSKLDTTTVDIAGLQAQAESMLKGTYAEGFPELPEAFQSLASGAQTGKDLTLSRYQAPAIEGDISAEDQDQVVVPPPVYDRQRAVDRDLMAGTVPFPSRGLMPAGRMTATDEEEFAPGISFEQKVRRSNLDQRPSLLDYEDIEMGDYGRVAPTEDTDPFNTLAFIKKHRNPNDPKNWLSGPELRKLMSEKGMLDSGQKGVDREFTQDETSAAAATMGKNIAQLGHDAFKRAEAAKAKAYEQSKLFGGTQYPGSLSQFYEEGTEGRLKALRKHLGSDATAFERNQRLQQQAKQKIFEGRRISGAIRR